VITNLKKYLPYILITIAVILLYWQNLWFELIYLDDNIIILDSFNVISSFSNITTAFNNSYLLNNYYRPIVIISFIIDTAIAGQSSMMYHFTNIILHVITSFLVYIFLLKFNSKKHIALFLSIFFSIHPFSTNAVSWIVGRNDILLALFSLSSILCFIKYLENNKKYWIYLNILFYLLAMFSKETGIIVPVTALLYYMLFNKNYQKKITLLFVILTFGLPLSFYLFVRNVLSHSISNPINFAASINNLGIIPESISKTILFFSLSFVSYKSDLFTIIGIILILALIIIFVLSKNLDHKIILYGFSFFLIFTTPILFISIHPIKQGLIYLACRLYLPLIGLLLVISGIINLIINYLPSRISVLIGVIFIVYSLTFSFSFNQYYKNGKSYWEKLVQTYPESSHVLSGISHYYYQKKKYDISLKYMENAIKLSPNEKGYYERASEILNRKGDIKMAIDYLKKAINFNLDNSINLGTIINYYLLINEIDSAKVYSLKLINYNFNPEEKANVLASSACLFYEKNEIAFAKRLFQNSLLYMDKSAHVWNYLSLIYNQNSQYDSAFYCIVKALEIEPGNNGLIQNFNNLTKKNKYNPLFEIK